MAEHEAALVAQILDGINLIDQHYYTLGWFRQCARAVLVLELRRSVFANAADIAEALIRRASEIRSGEGKGMTAFFMPEEAVSDDEILRDVSFEKQISYVEMLEEERRMKMPQTIHPVDLTIFCQLLRIPYLPEIKSEQGTQPEPPAPKKKRGRFKRK